MKLGIVGLGWWGSTLIEAVSGTDLRFVAAHTRSLSDRDRELGGKYSLKLFDSYEAMLHSDDIDAVVLASPPSGHAAQIETAAAAGKHIFCEKPFTMNKAEAERALRAVRAAGVKIGLGYNRRFHPSWIDLKGRIRAGELGVIEHAECTMSGPNALSLPPSAWRAQSSEAPCGGLLPMGVHAIDGLIDLFGEIDNVYCHSMRRASPSDNDDTTALLFQLRQGMSAYLSTMMATAGTFRFQVYGSKAMALLGGSVHVIGQSSEHRRSGLFGSYLLQPIKGEAQSFEVPSFDVNRAELEAFARAVLGGPDYPISHAQMIHGVAVTDAAIRSASSHQLENVT